MTKTEQQEKVNGIYYTALMNIIDHSARLTCECENIADDALTEAEKIRSEPTHEVSQYKEIKRRLRADRQLRVDYGPHIEAIIDEVDALAPKQKAQQEVILSTDPVHEAIARKLFGLKSVPRKEQIKMIIRAAKAGAKALNAEVDAMKPQAIEPKFSCNTICGDCGMAYNLVHNPKGCPMCSIKSAPAIKSNPTSILVCMRCGHYNPQTKSKTYCADCEDGNQFVAHDPAPAVDEVCKCGHAAEMHDMAGCNSCCAEEPARYCGTFKPRQPAVEKGRAHIGYGINCIFNRSQDAINEDIHERLTKLEQWANEVSAFMTAYEAKGGK